MGDAARRVDRTLAAAAVAGALLAAPAAASEPVPLDGVDAILAGLEQRPVVALGEFHGWSQEHDLIRRLVADSRFPALVHNVVVEFGSARYQRVMDRYIAGEKVRYRQLRKAWEQTTQGSSAPWNTPMYRGFFNTVRELNLHRPPDRQIRVLLGDPPINWARIVPCSHPQVDWKRPRCLDYWLQRRDTHFAAVTRRILSHGGRALMIAGAAHFDRSPPGVKRGRWGPIPDLIERVFPHSVWIVQPYAPLVAPHPEVERVIRGWPLGSIAAVAGTAIAAVPAADVFGAGPNGEAGPRSIGTLGDHLDALLYLG
jgi:hypothetical protein